MNIDAPNEVTDSTIGDLLLAVVALANVNGVDPEFALRARARKLIDEIQ